MCDDDAVDEEFPAPHTRWLATDNRPGQADLGEWTPSADGLRPSDRVWIIGEEEVGERSGTVATASLVPCVGIDGCGVRFED
jgi:hypothetical protein